jgi:hypothetical protein
VQDNVNTFLILSDETSGDLSTRSAVFAGGCLIAAAAHLCLLIVIGHSISSISAPGQGKGPYKTYENEMASQPQQQQQQQGYPPV